VQYIFYDLFKNYAELKAETLSSSVFINDGKGNFKRSDLTERLQLAPIMSFADAGEGNWIAGGNFYGVIPYEGRYDALFPTYFNWKKDSTNFLANLPFINGEIRDLKTIKTAKGEMLVAARNNQPLLFLKKVN